MKINLDPRKLALGFGLGLPLLFVLGLLLFVYLPANQLNTSQNFIYSSDGSFDDHYEMVDGKITPKTQPNSSDKLPFGPYFDTPTLYLFNSKTQTSTQLAASEIGRYHITSRDLSNDGYQVGRPSNNGRSPFWMSSPTQSVVLSRNGHSKRLPIDYSYDFKFIGWVR